MCLETQLSTDCDQNHLRSKTKKYIVETNSVQILDPPSEIFSPHCESRFDCKRNHCSSKIAVNRSVSLQFVYFSLSESLVNYGLESDLCVCCYLIQIAKKTYFSTPIQNNSGYTSTISDGRKPNPQFQNQARRG